MPVSCSTSALAGAEGSVSFVPAGTTACLLDFTDFPAGEDITLSSVHDFRIGDSVTFTEEGAANIDSALTADTAYFVVATKEAAISVSLTNGGTPITLAGDGGVTGADTPGAANHIGIAISDYQSVCQVAAWTVDLSRDELDVTTLPCGSSVTGGKKYAPTKQFVPSYLDGSGTMTVFFTPDQSSLANRLMANSLLTTQDGAKVKLFVSNSSDLYVESEIVLMGFSTGVSPDEATQAEVNFRLTNVTKVFGTDTSV